MGILTYLRGDGIGREEDRTLAPPQSDHRGALLPYSTPVQTVSESNALHVSDAWACVRALSDAVASLPVHVFRRTPAGRVPAGSDARAVQLLNRPSPGSTTSDLFGTAMAHLLVNGNCFVAKYRSDAEIVQLGLLDPRQVEVELRGQRVIYTITVNGRRSEHGVEDVMHVKGMSSDGLRGLSPVAACRRALGLSSSLQESARQFFEAGSRPSGILTLPPGTSDGGLERGFEAWRGKHEGVEKMHRVAVVEGDVTFTPIAFNADDSQFLQQRELSAREVARIFRVPAWLIDAPTGDSLTYSNTLEQNRAFVTHSLRPWLVRLERAFSNDADFCPGNTYIEFSLDGLLRADAAQRADIFTKALDPLTGWMSRSEVRELEDLPPEGEHSE